MNSLKKSSEDKLPKKSKFFSSLKDEDTSKKDYEKAKNILNTFKIKTLGEYYYFNYHGLDPCHYFSSPGLSWDAILKMTKVELEFISDTDMHFFIEQGMRGDISCITKRHSKTNNKYTKYYDSDKEKFLSYI